MSVLTVDARALHAARLTPPISKSDALRWQVLAELTGQPGERFGDAAPIDVQVLERGLEALRQNGPARIDCRDGGAPFRFLLTLAAIRTGGETLFTGSPRLGERPHAPLLEALEAALGPAGLRLERGTPWPLRVIGAGQALRPEFRIDAGQSSQFASSLALGAAALCLRERRPWTVQLLGAPASRGYLELTARWLRAFGFQLGGDAQRLVIEGHSAPASVPAVPGDWSSLGYLLLLAWRTGSVVDGVDWSADHPDRAVLRHLEKIGLHIERGDDGVRVRGEAHSGLEASAAEAPDLVPTLAALACTLPAPSRFTELEVLRLKESDRLEGIRELVAAIGGRAELDCDALLIVPPASAAPRFFVDSRGDHRRAMAAATLAVLTGSVLELEGPECVEKSFPGFWKQLEALGAVDSRAP